MPGERKKGPLDWGGFLRAVASGVYVEVARQGVSRPGPRHIAIRREADPEFARAYFEAMMAGRTVRGSKGRTPKPKGWKGVWTDERGQDWGKLLTYLRAGHYANDLFRTPGMPSKKELRQRVNTDPSFVAEYAAACMAGSRARMMQGKARYRELRHTMAGTILRGPNARWLNVRWEEFIERIADGEQITDVVGQPSMPTRRQHEHRRATDQQYRQEIARVAVRRCSRRGYLIPPERWERFAERVEDGEHPLDITRDKAMPSAPAYYQKRSRDPAFKRRIDAAYTSRPRYRTSQPRARNRAGRDDGVFAAVQGLVSASLPQQVRDEVVQGLMLEVLEGETAIEDASARVKEILRQVRRVEPDKYGDLSLDELAGDGFDPTAGDMPFGRSARRQFSDAA